MALINIEDKVPGDSNPEKRKILYTDVNQIKGALQTGVYDIKPNNVLMEGEYVKFIGGDVGFKYDTSVNKLKFSNDGLTWVDVNGQQDNTKQFTAGEDITAGSLVYLNSADGNIYKCDKADTSKLDWIGIAGADVLAGSTVDVYLNGSVVGGFSGLTAGEWYSVGSAGAIELGDDLPVGVAIDANNIKLIKQKPELRNYNKQLLSYTGTDLDASADNVGLTKEYVIGTISKDELYALNHISINLNTYCLVQSTGDVSYYGSITLTISISNDGGVTYTDIVSGDILIKGYNMQYETTFNYLKNYELTSTDKANGITIKIKIVDAVSSAIVSHVNKGIYIYGWR